MSFPPPPSVIYIVVTDGYYSQRDWRGSDIAFVTLTGVLLLVTLTCMFADCYKPVVREHHHHRAFDPYEYNDEAWSYERRRPPAST